MAHESLYIKCIKGSLLFCGEGRVFEIGGVERREGSDSQPIDGLAHAEEYVSEFTFLVSYVMETVVREVI
jgi:hypothetical protein